MTVLSDQTIREEMEAGRLIINGDPANAMHCTYEFKAARVTYGGGSPDGRTARVVDLKSGAHETATLAPGGVAWIRSHAEVEMPRGMVGLWIQTNSLSRKGMLLLNSTLIEPGYRGRLTAYFVNFGSEKVTVSARDTIAKIIFLKLDSDALEVIPAAKYQDYDAQVERWAAKSHDSVFRIDDFVERSLGRLKVEAEAELKGLVSQVEIDAKVRIADIEKNSGLKYAVRVGGGAVAGLLLGLIVNIYISKFWAIPEVAKRQHELDGALPRAVKQHTESDDYQSDLARLVEREVERRLAEVGARANVPNGPRK